VAPCLPETAAAQFEDDIARLREARRIGWMCWRSREEFTGATQKSHRTIMLFEAARASKGRRAAAYSRQVFDYSHHAALDEGRGACAEPDYRRESVGRARAQIAAGGLAQFFDRGYAEINPHPAGGRGEGAGRPTLTNTGDPRFCTIWTLIREYRRSPPPGKGTENGHAVGSANRRCGAEERGTYWLATVAAVVRGSIAFRGLV